MTDTIEARRALETEWRERTEAAHEQYRAAKEVAQMFKLQYGDGALPSPDGYCAYERALRIERATLAQYRQVLEAFNGLVLYFRIPPEE